jgi:protein O-GlcNAc transferase
MFPRTALKDIGRFDDAIVAYKQAIAIRPSFADALGNLASVFKDTGKLVEAISYYRKSLRLRVGSTDAIAYSNLVHCLQTVCQWENRDAVFAKCKQLIAQQMAKGQLPSVQPHHALVYPLSGDEQLEIAVHYARAALKHVRVLGLSPRELTPLDVAQSLHSLIPLEQDCCLTMPSSAHIAGFDAALLKAPRARNAGVNASHPLKHIAAGLTRRLRVGYVSSDFGNHPLAHLMNHVFVWHDPARFEVFAYATSPSDDSEWRAKISAGVEHFVEVAGMAHDELAACIQGDSIDVLVNLNGYTKGSRNEVFALRPAPVQLMYLGFPGSSGSHYMQYYVTDQVASPQQLQHLYTEKLAYMPHCYFVNDHAQSYGAQAAVLSDAAMDEGRAQYGLPSRSQGLVLAMFNQLYKIDPQIFAVWCAVLNAVPTAVLWLLQFPPAGEAHIRAQAAEKGVRSEQLVFSPVASKEEHISRGRYADLFLDTPLCNAHTTGTDILWGGVPLVTLPLESLASRVGASLLAAIGMPQLICRNMADYEVGCGSTVICDFVCPTNETRLCAICNRSDEQTNKRVSK